MAFVVVANYWRHIDFWTGCSHGGVVGLGKDRRVPVTFSLSKFNCRGLDFLIECRLKTLYPFCVFDSTVIRNVGSAYNKNCERVEY